MGFFSFRKVAEKTKQMVGFTSMNGKDGWKPSSNDRNTNMIEEARKFAQQLKSLHKDLTVLDKQIESSFGTMKSVLSSPLPRVYDTTAAGTLPLEKDAPIVGQAVNLEDITAAAADMRHKLQQEVLHPLDQWLAAYRSIKMSNKKVEDLRLELDSRRRAEMALQDKLAVQKAKISEVAEAKRPAAQAKASETEFKLQFEIDKVTRLTQRYQEIEAEVFNALLMLIKDTTVLKQYAAASLFIYQKCFSNAYLAFDLSAPLYQPPAPPAHPTPSVAITPSSPPSISGSPAQPPKPFAVDKIKAEGATPMSVTPAASKRPSHTGEEAEHPNKPGTPEQQVEAPVAEAASPAPPAWYVDARNNPENVAEDSDSDGESRPKNPFA